MATSTPAARRWAPDTPPAERAPWRWAVELLPDDVVVLPQVAMTIGRGGRIEEAEVDLVLLDPAHGSTVVEVEGGTLVYGAARGVAAAGSRCGRDP